MSNFEAFNFAFFIYMGYSRNKNRAIKKLYHIKQVFFYILILYQF